MGYVTVMIWFGGYWAGLEYKNGSQEVFQFQQITFHDLFESIHGIVHADLNLWRYVIQSLVVSDGLLKRKKIKNDADLARLLETVDDVLVVFVSLKRTDTGNLESVLSATNQNRITEGSSSGAFNVGSSHQEFVNTSIENTVQNFGFSSVPLGLAGEPSFYARWGLYDEVQTTQVGTSSNPRFERWPSPLLEMNLPTSLGMERIDLNSSPIAYANQGYTQLEQINEVAAQEPQPVQQERRSDSGPESQSDNDQDDLELGQEVQDNLNDEQRMAYDEFLSYILQPEWFIPDTPPFEQPSVSEFELNEPNPCTLQKGATFGNKKEMQNAVGFYHLKNQVEYRVDRSDKQRWYVKCTRENCPFMLNGREKCGIWYISKSIIPHECTDALNSSSRRHMPSTVIGEYYADQVRNDNSSLVPRSIIQEMTERHGLHLSYKVALRAKRHAMRVAYGDPKKSFAMLPMYLEMLKKSNPGTYTALDTHDDGKFKYVFFALGASICGFQNYSRPVIVVDGCHLKGQYKGIGFVAVTKDGNDQIFPLATGIGSVENDDTWTWFFKHVREAFGCHDQLLIVSDQHKSISNAIEEVYPEASHGFCCYHLRQNLAKHGSGIVGLFQKAAYCYQHSEFDRYIRDLEATNCVGALEILCRAELSRWSRVRCPVRRYSFMTSNAAESWNARLLWARKLPVCSFLECARRIMEKWFVERRESANVREQTLTKTVHDRLLEAVKQGRRMQVSKLGGDKYKVTNENKFYIVELSRSECTCMVFQCDGIPCSHACAAISFAKGSITSYVLPYYTTEWLRGMWANEVLPVPDPQEWSSFDPVQKRVCRAPDKPKQAGRPKGKRIPSSGPESRSARTVGTCSRCGQSGHNIARCTEQIPFNVQSGNVEDTGNEAMPKTRRKKKCSVCGSEEHTRRKCEIYLRQQIPD